MEKEESRPTVSLEVAQHTLWHFGDSNLGLRPGTFVERLLLTMSAADTENLEKLRETFPEYGAAFTAVAREHWGLEWLRSKVKRSLVPDRSEPNLFEAAVEAVPEDRGAYLRPDEVRS